MFTDPSKKRFSFAEHFIMRCEICKYEKSSNTSKRKKKDGKESFFDINVRTVHAAQCIGHSGLTQICAALDLPPSVTFNSHNAILKHVSNN